MKFVALFIRSQCYDQWLCQIYKSTSSTCFWIT